MALNREQRRKVADNVAAFMRGEIDHDQYTERCHALFDEIRRSDDRDKFAEFNALYEWPNQETENRGICVDKDTWQRMRYRLAFLESDLEMKRTGYREGVPSPRWLIFLVVAFVIIAAVAWAMYMGTGWGLAAVIWAAMGVGVRLVYDTIEYRVLKNHRDKQHRERDPYHPFNDEAQFRQHQHLLDRFNLPTYNPAIHNRPPARSRGIGERLFDRVIVTTLTLLFSLLVMTIAAVLGLVLFAWRFFLSKPDREPLYTAVPADESNSAPGRSQSSRLLP